MQRIKKRAFLACGQFVPKKLVPKFQNVFAGYCPSPKSQTFFGFAVVNIILAKILVKSLQILGRVRFGTSCPLTHLFIPFTYLDCPFRVEAGDELKPRPSHHHDGLRADGCGRHVPGVWGHPNHQDGATVHPSPADDAGVAVKGHHHASYAASRRIK